MEWKKSRNFSLTIAFLTLALDQVTKHIVRRYLAPGEFIAVVDGFFNLVHVRNTGVAFSLFGKVNPSIMNPTLIILNGGVLFFLLYLLTRKDPLFHPRVSLGLIVGGAMGNITDRILSGHVTDFLDFYVGKHHWPAFNVADASITCGIALILFCALMPPKGSSTLP